MCPDSTATSCITLADGAWFTPIHSLSYRYQQFTFFRHLCFFQHVKVFWKPRVCLHSDKPLYAFTGSFISWQKNFETQTNLFPRCRKWKVWKQSDDEGIKVCDCWGSNILSEETFAQHTPTLNATQNTQWCGSVWNAMFHTCCLFHGLEK